MYLFDKSVSIVNSIQPSEFCIDLTELSESLYADVVGDNMLKKRISLWMSYKGQQL